MLFTVLTAGLALAICLAVGAYAFTPSVGSR